MLIRLAAVVLLLLTSGVWSKWLGGALAAAVVPHPPAAIATTPPTTTPTATPRPSPVGPLAYPGTLCTQGSAPAHDLGGTGLICLPAPFGAPHWTWQDADPRLRLPIAFTGASCFRVGEHGWNPQASTSQVCSPSGTFPPLQWVPDPSWTPK